jgi:hypothetical protein
MISNDKFPKEEKLDDNFSALEGFHVVSVWLTTEMQKLDRTGSGPQRKYL